MNTNNNKGSVMKIVEATIEELTQSVRSGRQPTEESLALEAAIRTLTPGMAKSVELPTKKTSGEEWISARNSIRNKIKGAAARVGEDVDVATAVSADKLHMVFGLRDETMPKRGRKAATA